MFVIAVKNVKVVRYNHEIILIKHAKPNQVCYYVRYNRVFVITVIVITEFDCMLFLFLMTPTRNPNYNLSHLVATKYGLFVLLLLHKQHREIIN